MESIVAQADRFNDLPFDDFEKKNSGVYVIDYSWRFLYVNKVAQRRFNGFEVIGNHIEDIWQSNPEFNFEPIFKMLEGSVLNRISVRSKSHSPVTGKAIEIIGQAMEDCYLFLVNEQLDKEALIEELKQLLPKGDKARSSGKS